MHGEVRRKPRCPICKSDTDERWRPFCSRRCADVDLSRWLSGRYAIPVQDSDEDEDGDDPLANAVPPPETDGGNG